MSPAYTFRVSTPFRKKARDAFIEIDQKYASLDAELNGPPVIKDLQLEACKETDDNLVR